MNCRPLITCKTSTHSVYFEGAFSPMFQHRYKGVIVNARGYGGCGHFAIRKPITFWFKLPRFIKKLFPYRWVMWKNDREPMTRLLFQDADRSVNVFAEMKNQSYRTLTFDQETYEDLKEHIPAFLQEVGYKFTSEENDGCLTLVFEPVKDEN